MARKRTAASGPRFVRRRSSIHGFGVFARRPIAKGERVVEYRGDVIDDKEAWRRFPEDDEGPHTFLFGLDDGRYIDPTPPGRGNLARWINHTCRPNCEAVQDDDQVFIEAIRAIRPGEELSYEYGITLDEPHTPAAKARWACRCGAPGCTGTMLAKKKR